MVGSPIQGCVERRGGEPGESSSDPAVVSIHIAEGHPSLLPGCEVVSRGHLRCPTCSWRLGPSEWSHPQEIGLGFSCHHWFRKMKQLLLVMILIFVGPIGSFYILRWPDSVGWWRGQQAPRTKSFGAWRRKLRASGGHRKRNLGFHDPYHIIYLYIYIYVYIEYINIDLCKKKLTYHHTNKDVFSSTSLI